MSLGLKYLPLRDHPLKTSTLWLQSKREIDGAENLWRIHDKLYDLEKFIAFHPGGADWLRLTKGTDITEAFESHHIYIESVEKLLPKYYVREATTPRCYPFTFYRDGFYHTLKEKIRSELKNVPNYVKIRSKIYADVLFGAYVITALLSVFLENWGILLGMISGICLSMTVITAHNFFHQKDNFRMYYFDFCMMRSKEWRVSHALSHHLFPNTIQDLEISTLEPWLQYLPKPKNFFIRYVSWLYSPIFYALMFVGSFVRNAIEVIFFGKKLEISMFLPFSIPVLMIFLSGKLWISIFLFSWIIMVASTHFGFVGLNAAHHHPNIFHDGDEIRPNDEMDWGVFELDAVMDRKDITGSPFLVLTNFGDHALHHLFPTLDHGVLEYLYPIFLETCKDFGIDWRLVSQLDLIKGQFLQLARIKGNSAPPRLKKK